MSRFFIVCFLLLSGTATAQDLNFIWSKQLGTALGSGNFGNSIAIDQSENVYTTGIFTDSADFDPGPGQFMLTSTGTTRDIFISKLDHQGQFKWAKRIGGTTNDDAGYTIAVAPDGFVYVSGSFGDTVDFDPGPGVHNLHPTGWAFSAGFLLKLDTAGNFVWAIQTDNLSYGHSSIQFHGGYTYLNTSGEIIKIDQSGAMVSTIVTGGFISSFDMTAPGDIYLTGSFSGTVDFDPSPAAFNVTAVGGSSLYLQKLDTAGNFYWVKQWGQDVSPTQSAPSNAKDMVISPTGDLYITGYFENTTDFDPGSAMLNLTSAGEVDIFIMKLDLTGNLIWANRIGSTEDDMGSSIICDLAGNVYTSGTFNETVDFDMGPGIISLTEYQGPGAQWGDGYICKYNASGGLSYAKSIKGPAAQPIPDFVLSSSNNVYATGSFWGITDFDPGAGVHNMGTSFAVDNIFVFKWGQDSCSNMTTVVDSFAHVNCTSSQGYIEVSGSGGTPPYTYAWSNAQTVSGVVINTPGIYEVLITDSIGCNRSTSFLMNGASYTTGFDLKVNLAGNVFVPGFTSNVVLDAFNDGCVPQSGSVKLVVPGQLVYSGASPAPNQVVGDTLIWHFFNVDYFSPHLMPQILLTTDTTATLGDTVCLIAMITQIAGDADTTNNVKAYCSEIVGSFDPNDKHVYPQGACEQGYILPNTLLTYTINFQNTGTAPAVNVFVLDTLNYPHVPSSVRLVGSSHPVYIEVLPGNVLKFHFDNINLPDSNTDEPGSHGYLIFEETHDPNIFDGVAMYNRASIYFDFNAPVLTNTVQNTFVSTIPACPTYVAASYGSELIMLYPNPASDAIMIEYDAAGKFELIDISGRLRQTIILPQGRSKMSADLNGLATGLYMYRYTTGKEVRSGKLVVMH